MSIIILLLTMEREILEKIEKNTTNKPAFQIVLTGIGSTDMLATNLSTL